MASLSTDGSGKRRILFIDRDGIRRTIRLGAVSAKSAAAFCDRVDTLNKAKKLGTAIDPDTLNWLAERPDSIYKRLARVGLVEPRAGAALLTLGALLKAWLAAQDVKPSTLVRWRQTEAALTRHFGADRDAASITAADGERWRSSLRADGYATATISKHVQIARQVFRWAVRRGRVKHNPFADVKAGTQVNAARHAFIDGATIAAVLEACPDCHWRLLVSLSRYGGLRIPSEANGLRWSDVDWDRGRLTIRSPKTEHHDGHGDRIIPIFPELRGPLMEAFDAAEDGAEYVLPDRFRNGYNPHTHFLRIIRRAGVKPWPRLWHNLRASRQTELAASFPLHTVCAWIGNSKAVASGHYLQLTDADWARAIGEDQKSGAKSGARAAQKAAQHTPAPARKASRESSESPCFSGVLREDASGRDSTQSASSGRYWTRTSAGSSGKPGIPEERGAESGALSDDPAPADPRLAAIVGAWERLPEAIRRAMAAMIGD